MATGGGFYIHLSDYFESAEKTFDHIDKLLRVELKMAEKGIPPATGTKKFNRYAVGRYTNQTSDRHAPPLSIIYSRKELEVRS